MYYDRTILLILPALILAALAKFGVWHAFSKYSHERARSGITGAQLAEQLLANANITGVNIVPIGGELTDNFNPETGTLSLSESVYYADSISALGVAAHECGHVFQHNEHYAPLSARAFIVPSAQIGSHLAWPIFVAGIALSWQPLLMVGIALYILAVAFTLISLPVEFNASARALQALSSGGFLQSDELGGANAVLRAASLTYVASALAAILQLARLLLLAKGNRRRR